jgi:hypothetical protein
VRRGRDAESRSARSTVASREGRIVSQPIFEAGVDNDELVVVTFAPASVAQAFVYAASKP